MSDPGKTPVRQDGAMTSATQSVVDLLAGAVGTEHVRAGDAAGDDVTHDEALGAAPGRPAAVVTPTNTEQVAAVLRLAHEHRIPVTARGSGTGLSGAAVPVDGGVVVSFERMNEVLEVDTENNTATVQPGVTLDQLDEVLRGHDLVYPVFPGEYSASIGGNVNTNAGGMRAVKYGVTRHQVLGIEAVLAGGDVIRHGGKIVKNSTGYDLVQLITGSEGTLALVTEATLKLWPRLPHQATLLGAFHTMDQVTDAVPEIVNSGVGPMVLEYLDQGTLNAVCGYVGLDLGIPDDVRTEAHAYLLVVLENRSDRRLDEDISELGEQLTGFGAIDVYALPPASGERLIDAREKAFWVAKANNADDIVDVVVPRNAITEFLTRVGEQAGQHQAFVAGCGHAGDGNVHLSVFQPDPEIRSELMLDMFRLGRELGGEISGEHGLGRTKKKYFLALEDPAKIALYRRIKAAFDPRGILNPGSTFDLDEGSTR